ncbi:MAG: YbgC/FadM family acyl-CoA thioesterase [Candidatus Omnitrophica bacterium]|nr:YbgC/FadM family acyl-CoA thioesterase [Candidatus Omnitrophota bacterium]
MKDFYIEKKIYYHDTDSGGVVYYANYLRHLEEARTEYFLTKGINLKELANKDILFTVSRLALDYKSPARYQDILKVSVKIETIKSVSIEFYQEIVKDKTLMVEAKTRLVCVGKDFKPIAIPDEIKQSLAV